MDNFLQIVPQYCWHDDLTIEGNAAGLRALAELLLKAAEFQGADSDRFFPSDGEGYKIIVRRHENPATLRQNMYLHDLECPNPAHRKTEYPVRDK